MDIWVLACSRPHPASIVDFQRRSKMNPTRQLVIHELVPSEIMGVLFEEHAKLEWRAPAIDGRVCRIWRQIVLNTPRAWMYLEISDDRPPIIQELREWLDRSGSAPLYIRIDRKLSGNPHPDDHPLYNLLSSYHTRIASLRLPPDHPPFLDEREFPCLRLLDIALSYSRRDVLRPLRWDSMPELRSLRIGASQMFPLQLSELTQLEVLALSSARITSFPQHSQSLTMLMLTHVFFSDAVPSPMAFPSLTYLSMYAVSGSKRSMNAPRLVTFHEGGGISSNPFSSPVPSLVEYWANHPAFGEENLAMLHHYFPNLLKLSIRTRSYYLIPFLQSLSGDPQSLPALQMITVGESNAPFTEEEKAIIKGLVQVRGEACQMDVMLDFGMEPPFQTPRFFCMVSALPIKVIVGV